MGVRKYGNKWRAAVAQNGVTIQKYFDTEEKAHTFIRLTNHINSLSKNAWHKKTKKRSIAKHQDLPVGVCDYNHTFTRNGHTYSYDLLCCAFKNNGKQIFRRVQYGNKNTRAEALKILINRVNDYIKKHPEKAGK